LPLEGADGASDLEPSVPRALRLSSSSLSDGSDTSDLEPSTPRVRRRSTASLCDAPGSPSRFSIGADSDVCKVWRPSNASRSTSATTGCVDASSFESENGLILERESEVREERSASCSSVADEFLGAPRPTQHCPTSSKPVFPSSCSAGQLPSLNEPEAAVQRQRAAPDDDDYDPRNEDHIQVVSEEVAAEEERRLLLRQAAKLRAALSAREALSRSPSPAIVDSYRHALDAMEEQAKMLAGGPYAVPEEHRRSPAPRCLPKSARRDYFEPCIALEEINPQDALHF